LDNDGVWEAGDSIVGISSGGGGWTLQKINRATEGIQSWFSVTDWRPFYSNNSTTRKVWVNGTAPNAQSTCNFTWADLGQPYAATCTPSVQKAGGAWFRITDTDIFLNVNHFSFDWGTNPSSNPSARGIITHETGHGALLVDVGFIDCDPWFHYITMCESVGTNETWIIYTLETDDINSANDMYPP
jgi:hypothetical protein